MKKFIFPVARCPWSYRSRARHFMSSSACVMKFTASVYAINDYVVTSETLAKRQLCGNYSAVLLFNFVLCPKENLILALLSSSMYVAAQVSAILCRPKLYRCRGRSYQLMEERLFIQLPLPCATLSIRPG